ncbi:MAG: extracellular solute-binding protein [Spirochaetales bacterium]|nr:extracellular solute-binding protein [Spirochaetales bacterium]
MKKLLSLLLILSLMTALFAGGSKEKDDGNTLHFITRGVTISGSDENKVKTALEEKFGVKINWEVLPSNNYKNQAQAIIASGEYPDMMEYTISGVDELQDIIDDGVLMPLKDLLAKYGDNILADRPEGCWYEAKDGEYYAIPCRYNNYPETFYIIRQDWLDKLGLEMPTTLDELVEVAYAFTYKDPDGNGIDDTWGFNCAISGKWYEAMMPVLGAYGVYVGWMEQDGRLIPWQLTDNCREAIRYFKEKIYQQGLVDPNFMVLSRNESLDNMNQNKYGILYWYLTHTSSSSAWWSNFTNANPQAVSVALTPVSQEGYKTVFPAQVSSGAPTGFILLFFADSKNAEKTMEILNYLATDEGANLVALGIEGYNYEIIDGKYVEKELSTSDVRASGKDLYSVVFWHNMYKMNSSDLTLSGLEALKDYTVVLDNVSTTYDGDTSALSSLMNSMIVDMIVHPETDVDAAYEEMISKYMSMGGAEYIEWYNAQMNK